MGRNSGQSLKNIKLYLKILILTLSLTTRLSDAVKDSIEINPSIEGGDWELIEEGWPTVGSNPFIYVKNTTDEQIWILSDTYFKRFNDEKVFRLKFKFWMKERRPKMARISSFVNLNRFDESGNNVVSLRDRYSDDMYNDNWMPFEFMFSKKDCNSIVISTRLGSDDDFVAFKDILIEQELNQLKENTINTWKCFGKEFKYLKQLMLDKKENIFYFVNDDCSKGCTITLNSTIIDNVTGVMFQNILENAEISFEPNSITDKYNETNKILYPNINWHVFNESITDLNRKSFKIIVKTKEVKDLSQTKLKLKSFVAIRGLEVVWENKANPNEIDGSNDNKFPFLVEAKSSLINDLNMTDETEELFFTDKSLSTIEILLEDFFEKDHCLIFEYMTQTRETELIFSYSLNGDEFKQVFFTSTPSISKIFLKHETLCLSSFIALQIKKKYSNLKLSITVKFNEENTMDNKFYLRALKLEPNDKPTFLEFPKFLGDFSEYISNDPEEWKNQWKRTRESLFTLIDDHIELNVNNNEKNLKSSELSSDWIRYDVNNIKMKGNLMFWLDDKISFNSFILSAKICNSISKCQWVSLKYSTESNKTHTYYDFIFNGFNLTEDKPELIRLVFNVKYGFTNEKQVTLKFKLLNFGNPCYGSKYCKLEVNSGEKYPKPNFDCPQELIFIDGDCKPDNCFIRHDITDIKKFKHDNWSGYRICSKFNSDLPECLPDGDGFRCECEKLDKNTLNNLNYINEIMGPIYDRDKFICKQPRSTFTAWDNLTNPLRPIENNNLEIFYENIKSEATDICIIISYEAQDLTYIKAQYNTEDLFEVSLDNKEFEFCLLDFKTTIENFFSVNIKFRKGLNSFKLEFVSSYGKKAIHSNKYKSYSELGILNNWIALPRSLWDDTKDIKAREINGNNSFKALLSSGWIESDKDFNNFKNAFKFELDLKLDLIKFFKIEESIRDNKNNKIYIQNLTNLAKFKLNENNDGTIKLEKNLNTPFRIIFEIENTYSEISKYKLIIKDLIFGYGCQLANGSNSCPNKQSCTTTTFNNFKCLCGKNCDSNCSKLKSLFNDNQTTAIDYCQNSASLPDIPNKCHDSGDSYECDCPTSDFKWSIMNKTCKREPDNVITTQTCSSSECEFLKTSKIQWSNAIMPKVNDKLFPFYYATKSGGKLLFKINVNSSQEVCFRFHYWAPLNSGLRILYQGTQGLFLGQTFNSKEKWFPQLENEWQIVCSSDIEKYNSHNNLIGFQNTNIVAFKFEKVQEISDKTIKMPLPYLTIIDKKSDVSNQWSLLNPKTNPECLQISKDNPNEIKFKGCGKDKLNQTSYLISNIIKNDSKYRKLGFNISKIVASKDLRIKVVLFDEELNIIETVESIMDSSLNAGPNIDEKIFYYNKLNFTNLLTEFRIGFIIEYTDPSTSFTLNNLNINDPCITDENNINKCNNKGNCERRGSEAFCNCQTGWMDIRCETKDWCNATNTEYKDLALQTGNQICEKMNKSKSCINSIKGFICECENGYFWEDNKHICRSMPGCLDKQCGKNEICIYSNDEPKCACAQYFVNINYKNNKTELNCQKFDWCNNDHIEFIKDLDYDTKYKNDCKYKCDKMSEDEKGLPQRMCYCPSGTVKTEKGCDSFKCYFPTMNNCKQICITNNSISDGFTCECKKPFYELKENNECSWRNASEKCPCKGTSFCDENKKCICRKNYKYYNNDCVPDIDEFKNLNSNIIDQTCPGGFQNNGTELTCKCNNKTKLNSKKNVCEPKALCAVGSDIFEECKKQNAVCTYNERKNAICECLPGEDWTNKNNSINKGLCVGLCELFEKKSQLSYKSYCENLNAICDSFSGKCICKAGLFPNNKTGQCEASSKTVPFKISIKNIDSLFQPILKSSTKVLLRYKREIDENNNQFNREDFNKTYENNLIKKIEFVNNNDRQLTITKEKLKEKLLIVLKTANKDFTLNDVTYDSCVLKDKILDCNILLDLPTQYGKEVLSKFLKDSCHPKGKECFFYQNSQVLFTMDSSSFHFNDYKPCEINRCENFADCKAYNGLYSCLCNDDFKAISTTKINVRGSNDQQTLQTCQMKELCENICRTKTTDNMSCQQKTAFNKTQQKWSAKPECICAKNYNLIYNNKNQPQCIGVCKDINCNNNGKCQFKGINGFACLCDEGWSGEQCETEHKVALGGWIAGIVILALLVVVVSGIAFVFYRRSSNGGYNGSGHQMDDYSGQSFRAQQRGPSQGSDNPAFHRN